MAIKKTTASPAPRVAVAHLFATGPHHPDGPHGLLTVGLLALTPDAQPRTWVLHPGRAFGKAVQTAARLSNDEAAAAPSWADQRAEIQTAFAAFDALLILDRAGRPSPERHWLEALVLTDQWPTDTRPPVCIALDELTACFLPATPLDDAAEVVEQLVLTDAPWAKHLAYSATAPQLPFVLHGLRRLVRRVLASVLRPVGAAPGEGSAGTWQPVAALLYAVLLPRPRHPALRAFRLLYALLPQANTCCDDALPYQTTREREQAALRPPDPAPPAPQPPMVRRLLHRWLEDWQNRLEDAGPQQARVLGESADVTDAVVDTAFEELGRRLGAGEYRKREPQLEYAHFVAHALRGEPGAYALEAGTGTGKTFGYLVPSLEYLLRAPGAAVIVATSTKNLQDQIRTGELPALLARDPATGRRTGRYAGIRAALLKGKNAYCCAEALAEQFEGAFGPRADWPETLSWLYLALRLRDTQGETEGAAPALTARLADALPRLTRLTAADRACTHGRQRQPGDEELPPPCPYPAHRARAEGAHLIITNHHKLALLPPKLAERASVCIVDEADRFPDNFRNALAQTLDLRELLDELVHPLLGTTPDARPAPPAPVSAQLLIEGLPAAAAPAPPEPPKKRAGFLDELLDRMQTLEIELWRQVPTADQPPLDDDAALLTFELLEDARLHERLSQADLREQVALAMADTPAAPDARTDADAAWQAVAAVALPLRRRRAVRTVLMATRAVRPLLLTTGEKTEFVGRLFVAESSRAPAVLPFPPGDTRWQEPVRVWEPGRGTVSRALDADLLLALRHLDPPLYAAAAQLALVGQQTAVALNLLSFEAGAPEDGAPNDDGDGNGGADPTDKTPDASDPDQRLRLRAERFTAFAGQRAALLRRMLGEFPTAHHVHVVTVTDRTAKGDFLAVRLTRVPYYLWPYLRALPPPDGPDGTPQHLTRLPAEPATPLLDLFKNTVLFTSATLYAGGALDFFRTSLDLREPFRATARIASPFDYAAGGREQVVGLLPAYLPRWQTGQSVTARDHWREAALQTLLPLLLALDGRTLVLFTANDDLTFAARWLAPRLAAHDIELLTQNGASQWEIRRFRRVEQSVLLGVDRMWTGVDFPGATLRQVVVWRGPFPLLGDPLMAHRRHVEADRFWRDFYQPAAQLKTRQGFGRLVRREKDKGAFVVLDTRLRPGTALGYVLADLEIELTEYATPADLLAQTVGQVLPLVKLHEEFERRGWSVARLAAA